MRPLPRLAFTALLLPLAACERAAAPPAAPATAADSAAPTGEVVPGVAIAGVALGVPYDSVASRMGPAALDAAGPGELLTAWRRPAAGAAAGDSSGWVAVHAVADTSGGTGYHVRMVRASPDAVRPGGLTRGAAAAVLPGARPLGLAHLYDPDRGVGLTFAGAVDTARATSVFVVAPGTAEPSPLDALTLPRAGGR